MRSYWSLFTVAILMVCCSVTAQAQEKKSEVQPALPKSIADGIQWRSIGPANMGGRITAIAVYEADPNIWWAATASGGLLKTVNNGNDFEHQFDKEATVSIGDVQVAQSDPNIVWVGTGESNPRNSVSWGDGVYKSTDGGKTWNNMGLKNSFQTGALAIHPTNPDIVWVGSLGRLWGPNEERGLFKTTDGGKKWKKVLYVDDKTGVVDVQLNPKNPDEMLVATYERKRDGFDGNDPEQRFGEGAGIYKSTDGGETFERVSKGLPTCKLGRIGLDYFESDPNFVFAVVESEKIGSEPPDFPYLGVRGTPAEVGAKITRITAGQAAAKAGLKVDDIVVSVDGRIVANYQDMLDEIYKRSAGDEVKLVVVRDSKTIDISMKLEKKPSNQRSSRSYFTGTLGGQGANRQDMQGENGNEYGGVYMSQDGGSTWERINSLNPRPMYYSNIQVDPVDRNNIYLCGTSLYKSSDGGKTFTGDGGSDGIHVDHHALWIDKRDARHMILGNDGGIHVTFDRMAHWDHHNHVAIGQFYHVGVDSNDNYMVYGGLQDNGSWGGPSRNNTGGIFNSDWFNVGGGDGFVTLADPDDPDQIYYESQNGGMGRIHLETGERGFIRKPRGMRFNWKTPFMLSPHNSKIHYSVGNHVLRSLNKGDNAAKISPDITNTQRGAGSAVTESPREAGVLYAGTTDGALWVTRDGGANWNPLFFNPEKSETKKSETKKSETKKSETKKPETKAGDDSKKNESEKEKSKDDSKKKKPKKEKPGADSKKASNDADPISGRWMAKLITDRIPEDRAKFELNLKLDGEKVTGSIRSRSNDQKISDGKFDPKTGTVSFQVAGGRGTRSYSGKLENGKMVGTMSIANGRMEIGFSAKKDEESNSNQLFSNDVSWNAVSGSLTSILVATTEDPITGVWKGRLVNDQLPTGEIEFSITMKLNDKNSISGQIDSPQGVIDITEGVYNPESKRVILNAESDEVSVEITGTLNGNSIKGEVFIADAELEIDFEVNKEESQTDKPKATDKPKPEEKETKPETKVQDKDTPTAEPQERPRRTGRRPSGSGQTRPSRQTKTETQEEDKDKAAKDVVAKKDDPITGTWTGKMTIRNSERDMKIILVRKDNNNITGRFDTGQGDREITSGTYDPKSKMLSLMSEMGQGELEFSGTVGSEQFDGEMKSGRFQVDLLLKRTSKTASMGKENEVAKTDDRPAGPTGEGSLASLLPGPRWVSSLEASRFKAGRCYVTMDGHRSNDDGVYAFVTEDYGKTWKSLTKNLPAGSGSVRVLREDLVNENLLLMGCEFSAWFSIDRGETWTKIGGLPTVAVHEFAIHPTSGEVVAGTHGRSLWIADISILRQITKETLAADLHLFQNQPIIRTPRGRSRGSNGTRSFVGQNPSSENIVAYSLGKNARRVSLRVLDIDGEVVREFEDVSRAKGFHTYPLERLATGTFKVQLKVDGQVQARTLEIKADPSLSRRGRAVVEQEDDLTEFEEFLLQSTIND